MGHVDKELVECVKEMNEAEYLINTLLLREYRALLDDEITTKQALLLELIHKHQRMTVKEIAEQMEVSSSAVSQIVGKLEKMGYVKREINLQNRREIIVQMGTQGFAYFTKQEEVERDIITRFYAKMELEEVRQLRALTLKLKKIVEQELSRT
ncbi:MarR family winged helix-turn-helix transcriptional regulator [Brevibacillus invocatus]|uniref:MarR family winged helix-turn-helix transcriptional regulator n=1 Tax=Brevibacillus invocatus TaxID=173959 RepID=UPI002041689E|nr:MarR family transcriptional regulator [Brevibacillus invocatus]MCM3081893.1 MarR family transcriptional regulator [Brevibacillus invocatus]MCM3432299.1 MarR family transcriptional regulator [Brevibacillus invocatus]